MRGVFLDRDSLDCGDLDFSAIEQGLSGWEFFAETLAHEAAARVAGANVVVSNKVMLGADELRRIGTPGLVCIAATGTNNVDLEAAQRLGIPVSNVTGYATPSVVEHVFALILGLMRKLEQYHGAALNGRWAASKQFCLLDYPLQELSGKTLGIVGFGELGKAVAQVAQAFGMSVLVAQRPGSVGSLEGRLPLHELLPRVDVLSLHCPLNEQTRNLIGARELSLMKSYAVLINTARGGVVDEQALADSLRNGVLGGAGVDVLAQEPPRQGSPLLQADVPNLIVTPHVAWGSRESRQRLVDEIAKNIASWKQGTVRNPV